MTVPVGLDSYKQRFIALVCELVRELHGQGARAFEVSLSSRLDRDLGIDSLGRTELILRIERVFRIRLPAGIMGEAETVGDILAALDRSPPSAEGGVAGEPPHSSQPAVAAAMGAKTLVEALEW